MFFDENLNWKVHIHYICEKLSKIGGVLAKLRYCVGINFLKEVYYALGVSHLHYCNLVWGNASENILKIP